LISVTLDQDAGALAALHCRYFAARLVPFFIVIAVALGGICHKVIGMPGEMAITFSAIALIAWSLAYFFRMKRTYAKRLKHPVTYQVADEGVTISTKGIESKIEWPRFLKVREMVGFWLLFYTEMDYVAFPLAKLGAQRQELRDMLRAKGIAGVEKLS
jgi:hypothetical protein